MGCAVSSTQNIGIEPVRKSSKDIQPWPEEALETAPKRRSFGNLLKSMTPVKAPADAASDNQFKPLSSINKLYDLQEVIGRGSYAEVRVCVDKQSQAEYAIKILEASSGHEKAKATRELDVWRRLGSHGHITTLLFSYADDNIFYFVMPRCSCSIFDMLKKNGGTLRNDFIIGAIPQVFLGLEHCHSLNIIHRDIKAANLLVDLDGTVRIADFGLSVDKPLMGKCGFVGSVPYMSPEMVKGEYYGFETDIWSFGVVIYCAVYGQYPYDVGHDEKTKERKKLIAEAIATNTPPIQYEPKGCNARPSLGVQSFIEKVLERNPYLRPSATLCSQLSFAMKEVEESSLEASGPFLVTPEVSFKEDREKADSSMATTCPPDGIASISFAVISDPAFSRDTKSYMM